MATFYIVKNATSITPIDDWKFDFKRDGGFNTCEVHFYSTNKNLLSRWDRVTFEGYSWRVAINPKVKINYEASPDWLYTVILIEPSAILQGVQMPRTTFTQDLDKTKTLKDAIEEELKKQSIIAVGDTYTYTLKAVPSVDLTAIAPDNKFEKENLYQRLKFWGDLIEAKPVLNETTNEIDFEYFQSDNGITLTPNFIDLEFSHTTDNYATDIIEDLENADLKGVLGYYPNNNFKTYMIPIDLNENLDWDNAKIVLPEPVKLIWSIIGVLGENTYHLVSYDSEIYNKRIFEKQEWDTLERDTLFGFIPSPLGDATRRNSLYWEYGKNEIFNVSAIRYNLAEFILPAASIKLYVEYEALPSIQIERSSGNTIDGGLKYCERKEQLYNTVDFESEGIRLQNEIDNMQSEYYNGSALYGFLPDYKSKITVLGNDYLIERLIAKREGDFYVCDFTIPTIYTKKNLLTQVVSENRIFEIPSTQIVTRKIVNNVNAKINIKHEEATSSTGVWGNYNYNAILNLDGLKSGIGTPVILSDLYFMLIARWKYKSSSTYVYAAMPYISFMDRDKIIIKSKMISNTAVEWQRYIDNNIPVEYTALSGIVTDENGEIENVQFKMFMCDENTITFNDGVDDFTLLQTYPFVSADFWADGKLGSSDTVLREYEIWDDIKINKDRRELLEFENNISISRYEFEDVYAENIFNVTRIRREKNAISYTIKAITNGVEITVTDYVVTFFPSYVNITFKWGASGTVTGLKLYSGLLLLFQKDIFASVTLGNSSYINISIKE